MSYMPNLLSKIPIFNYLAYLFIIIIILRENHAYFHYLLLF